MCSSKVVTLDFEARVPVPFSIFPSSYKEDKKPAEVTTSETHQEFSVQLPQHHERPGREGQYSSHVVNESNNISYPYREEEVRITREEERYRPGVRREFIRENRPRTTFSETTVDYESRRTTHDSAIDVAEREYRTRYQPNYREEARTSYDTTVDSGRFAEQPQQSSYQDNTTVDASFVRPQGSSFTKTKVTEEIIEPSTTSRKSNKMGYYDEEVREPIEVAEYRETVRTSSPARGARRESETPANTVTIPCHHIRIGDILILQGRPCQVIRISTSAATGQHRYLGVDLFTKKLHEESSFVSSPSPSVVVQTMLGPVFKQYRVLDLQEGNVVAMTETGDVKQGLPVIDQSNLWARLLRSFESGRGSVRVLVVNDHGRELAVDMKVVHGASL